MDRRVTGWKLYPEDRARLLGRFEPRYAQTVADHVTLKSDDTRPPPADTVGRVIGVADDGDGVQALVVEIGGTTNRPSGGTYHITWSLAEGRQAKESNKVIGERGWTAKDGGEVRLTGTAWP